MPTTRNGKISTPLWWLTLLWLTFWSNLPHVVNAATQSQTTIPDSLSVSTSNHQEFKRKAALIFKGDVSITSDPLPPETTSQQVAAFLHRPKTRQIIASGGQAPLARPVELTTAWKDLWKTCCQEWYGTAYFPQPGDSLYSCDTYTHFPGMKLCTTVYTAMRPITKSASDQNNGVETTSIPGYCSFLIGQKQTPSGLPPVVWIFNQLMGRTGSHKPADSNHNDTNHDDDLSSLKPMGPVQSFIMAQQISKNKESGGWCLQLNTTLEMKVEFPAVLLKIMPVSKSRAEAQGSTAITKTIAKASRESLEAARQAFLQLQQKEKKQNDNQKNY